MSQLAIKVENLSKQYRLGQVGTGTLSHDLNRWWHRLRGQEDPYLKIGEVNRRHTKGGSAYVWALRDIDFELPHGQVLGIIGKNGAGKSTLLKIFSKVTGPTTGRISIWGRTASLLEVGTGFHPELTGKENIYLNGAILGMTKLEIKSKLDEIIDFSGCERYIDTPIKRYSSGMKVRLAFAVAAHLEPEILIVDEVLAVGDAEFQEKALGKMKEVSQKQGRTVLFVSHNMATIHQLCAEVMVLENGMVGFRGVPEEGIRHYLAGTSLEKNLTRRGSLPSDPVLSWDAIRVRQNNIETAELMNHLPVQVSIDYTVKQRVQGLRLFLHLEDEMGSLICKSFFDEENFWGSEMAPGNCCSTATLPPDILVEGTYHFKVLAGIRNQRMIRPGSGISRKVYVAETGKISRKGLKPSEKGKVTLPIRWTTKTKD